MAATVLSTDWRGSQEPTPLSASSMRRVTLLPSVRVAWWIGCVSTATGKNAMGCILVYLTVEYLNWCRSSWGGICKINWKYWGVLKQREILVIEAQSYVVCSILVQRVKDWGPLVFKPLVITSFFLSVLPSSRSLYFASPGMYMIYSCYWPST